MSSRLSIIVPAYNEERTIATVIDRLQAACPFAEMIFVDDGSTDATLSIMKSKARAQDKVLTKPNGGKGSAVRMGYEHATGTYTIIQDADLEYSPEEIPAILALAEQNQAPAVFGSRRIKDQHQYAHVAYYIGGTLLTWIFNILYGTHLTDQPNCYKLVRTDIIRSFTLTQNGFGFDSELTALLARLKVPILEIPTTYHPRSVAEGKKIGATDFVHAILIFISLRFKSTKNIRD
jgi:glycosyltransferase involved in cell wall biosynthesis